MSHSAETAIVRLWDVLTFEFGLHCFYFLSTVTALCSSVVLFDHRNNFIYWCIPENTAYTLKQYCNRDLRQFTYSWKDRVFNRLHFIACDELEWCCNYMRVSQNISLCSMWTYDYRTLECSTYIPHLLPSNCHPFTVLKQNFCSHKFGYDY